MTTKQNRVLLIDGMNTFIRSWVLIPITNEDGEHYGGVYGFLRSVKAAVDKFNPTEVVIAWDGAKSGLRRKELFPEYKGNRQREWTRGSIRAYDFLSEQQQADNFRMQRNRVSEYLETLPVKVIRIPYVEADDIIAIYTQRLSEDSEVIIYSSDADFKQLVNEKVSCYNPIAKQLTTPKSFKKKYLIDSRNYIVMKSIMGDKSDNIPGIKGIGEKTLVRMFPELQNEHVISLDDVIAKSYKIGFESKDTVYTKSVREKFKSLSESADQVRLNHRIMQLQNPEISNEAKRFIYKMVDEPPQKFDSIKLKIMFLEDKLHHTIKSYDIWADTFAGLQTR